MAKRLAQVLLAAQIFIALLNSGFVGLVLFFLRWNFFKGAFPAGSQNPIDFFVWSLVIFFMGAIFSFLAKSRALLYGHLVAHLLFWLSMIMAGYGRAGMGPF